MAYASTIAVTNLGGGAFFVQLDETDAGALANEVDVTLAIYGLPTQGRVYLQQAALTVGGGLPGATIDPILATVAGSTVGTEVVAENDAPAQDIVNMAPQPIPYYAPAGHLYARHRCSNLAADHTIRTCYMIRRGWMD